MFLNIVTDDELLTSQIVKTILLFIIAMGILYNIIRIIRAEANVRKIINLCFLILLIFIATLVYRQYRVEAAMLEAPMYVSGTTLGDCNVFAEGRGISFEYVIDGKKYIVCNTYHPLSRDSIKVRGGIYKVRYAEKFPDQGRMDFNQPVK